MPHNCLSYVLYAPKCYTREYLIGARAAGRGVGTQNYTSSSTSAYVAGGAVADMFLQNGTKVGRHFFITNSQGGISPVFTRVDSSVR